MLSAILPRMFRPCTASRSVCYLHVTALRHGAPVTVRGLSAVSGEQLHAVRRSFFGLNDKLQPYRTSIRCLSTNVSSEDGKLIYTGSMGTAVRGVKLFSYSTSGTCLIVIPHIVLKTGIGVTSLAMYIVYCGFISFFTFITPFLLHILTKGYVIRLYHNPDTDIYTAITYSIFLTEKKHVFHQREVTVPAVSKLFTNFCAGNKDMLVNPDMFLIPQDYNHLMGYDKPFTFDREGVNRPDES